MIAEDKYYNGNIQPYLSYLYNENNRYGSLSKYVKYILHKKVIFGYCGSTIHGVSSTARAGEKKHYYRCPNNYIKKTCDKQSVRKDDLENVVIQAIMTLFDNDNMINDFADKIIDVNVKRLQNQSILKILQGEQDKIIKAKHNIISAIEQGIITASTKERLQELELQQEELSAKIMIEESKVKTAIKKADIIEFIKKALNNNAEHIVDLLVKQIVLYDDKLIIKCNYSDKPESEYLEQSISSSKTILNCISKNTPIQIKEVELNIKA